MDLQSPGKLKFYWIKISAECPKQNRAEISLILAVATIIFQIYNFYPVFKSKYVYIWISWFNQCVQKCHFYAVYPIFENVECVLI